MTMENSRGKDVWELYTEWFPGEALGLGIEPLLFNALSMCD